MAPRHFSAKPSAKILSRPGNSLPGGCFVSGSAGAWLFHGFRVSGTARFALVHGRPVYGSHETPLICRLPVVGSLQSSFTHRLPVFACHGNPFFHGVQLFVCLPQMIRWSPPIITAAGFARFWAAMGACCRVPGAGHGSPEVSTSGNILPHPPPPSGARPEFLIAAAPGFCHGRDFSEV